MDNGYLLTDHADGSIQVFEDIRAFGDVVNRSTESLESVLWCVVEALGAGGTRYDEHRIAIGSEPGDKFFRTDTDQPLVNVHDRQDCDGRPCVIHNPSDHHMRDWPMTFREDRGGLMERLCPHGIGHPDPDSLAYVRTVNGDGGIHGCDGCCRD